jgi:hypothetical protein
VSRPFTIVNAAWAWAEGGKFAPSQYGTRGARMEKGAGSLRRPFVLQTAASDALG